MKITCIETPTSAKGAFAIIYAMTAWPARVLQHRGWDKARIVYERSATEDEIAERRESTRMLAFRYPDRLAVVADEAKYGIDAEACRKVRVVECLSDVRSAANCGKGCV